MDLSCISLCQGVENSVPGYMPNMPKVPKVWGFEMITKIGEPILESDAECFFDDVGMNCDQFLGP